jgi:hypothetical protein
MSEEGRALGTARSAPHLLRRLIQCTTWRRPSSGRLRAVEIPRSVGDELHTHLDDVEAAVRALRRLLEKRGFDRTWFLPSSEALWHREMRRLGVFTLAELASAMERGRSAAGDRVRVAANAGLVVVDQAAGGSRAATYRWVA